MLSMTAGDWFVAVGFLLNFGAAVSYAREGTLPLALMWFCYAVGNIAIVWMAHWRVL